MQGLVGKVIEVVPKARPVAEAHKIAAPEVILSKLDFAAQPCKLGLVFGIAQLDES
jgi:hypothetical protein